MSQDTTASARERQVWLGDVVRVGGGATPWRVVRTPSAHTVWLESPKGVIRGFSRERVTLIERCPDGPQLERWLDGRTYLGEQLVHASDVCSSSVTWWRDEGTRYEWPHTVTLSVTTDRQLHIQATGCRAEAGALLPRSAAEELALSLLKMIEELRR